MIDERVRKGIHILFFGCLVILLSLYAKGYHNSIGWEVTTSAEVLKYPAIEIEGNLLDFSITGEKYLLTESYTGGPIERNRVVDTLLVSIGWIGVCLALTASSFLRRYGFLFALGLFTLFINRLNLGDIGLFGIQNRMVMLIPFLGFIGSLFYFHEYRPQTKFFIRFLILVFISALLVLFGVSEPTVFLDYFVSHSLFGFAIAGLLFLFILAEENVFGILFLVTRVKGGKKNFQHFIILSIIYLLNLILYYLNKSGLVPNSFSFFDPFVLLATSCAVAYWTLKFKANHFREYAMPEFSKLLFYGLGIVLFSTLGLAFYRGNDGVYESFHYFILYFHIGFGFFFLLYLIINFIDAFLQGFEVYKIAYKEQHFPYVSARLGGLVVVLGFYFFATQEPYDLLKSAYYCNLGNLEETLANPDLADQYYQQASFLGYNTHHSNYQLAWNYSDKGNKYLTQTYFEKAASRFPSAFAFINYSNLDMDINPVKVQATLEQAQELFNDGEIKNNYGLLRMQNEEWEKAFENFKDAESGSSWNQAPLINKWAALNKMQSTDSLGILSDYDEGNHGVKSNILATDFNSSFGFTYQNFEDIPVLHRQAYLLNATSLFKEDTLASLAIHELENSTNANYNDRLRKGLAIHYYKKGEVNKAFRMMDYLQANTYQHVKGAYLNDIGKLALAQGDYRLALEYFQRAGESDYITGEINKVEALAALGREDEIPESLLKTVEKDPGLTTLANQILSNIEAGNFTKNDPKQATYDLAQLEDSVLIAVASRNAFDERTVIEAVRVLEERGNTESYTVILEAIEINPYSVDLLKTYAITALKQNFTGYAEAVLPRIATLVDPSTFSEFVQEFNNIKENIEKDPWN